MTTRSVFFGGGLASKIGTAGIAALLAAPMLVGAQPASDGKTTSIQRDSDAAKAMTAKEPTYQTRDERLKAKPLDWNATIGKPTPHAQTAAEKEALTKAPPGATEGGKPDPKAVEEARRLHPDDWK